MRGQLENGLRGPIFAHFFGVCVKYALFRPPRGPPPPPQAHQRPRPVKATTYRTPVPEAALKRRSSVGRMAPGHEALDSRQFSTPSRQSEGIKVVNLSEHALAASDFAEELRSGRRALESIDVNVDNAMKNGRTPAFVGQTAFVMKDGRPKLIDRSQDSMDSPPSRSMALDVQRALQGFLTWVDGAPPPPRPLEATACERMLPELGKDGVMW